MSDVQILTLEYGNILYSGAALQIEHACCSTFPPLLHHRNAAIIGLVCRLLAGEGRENLHYFVHYFMELMTLIVGQAVSMPGTLQIICISLIHVTSDHLTDLDAVGKF